MDIRIISYAGLLLLITNPALSTDIQRWVDKDGQINFGDIAPQGTDSIPVKPEIITTAPSSNDSLKEILRPGERRMLKSYEKRGKRLIKAKRNSQKKAKRNRKQIANAKKKCSYHRRKKNRLKRRLREGYKSSEKRLIEDKIAKHELKVDEYCN